MKKFLMNLQFLFKPSYWIMNYTYSIYLDKYMNNLLDKHEFELIDHYTARLGNDIIWITNRPYACMIPRNVIAFHGFRPSRLTIQRGIKKLKNAECKMYDSLIKGSDVK
ncbi:hypothetical protein [Elizabethkingia meningoseptica]|uniref:hypothetical protein n=1 Tax=Elizabethkingia meningoseptica TaxID=238 RepID=UPI0023B00514|nr:hypothetical protein [Elizabethkingia meningoseptica]MDE5526656.1 hypothetical protein [Elizabethkingia meningoseptica]